MVGTHISSEKLRMLTIGSLNGAASKPILPPGELDSMNPKSMCIRWASRSSKMFPLCLSLICSRKVTIEYPVHGELGLNIK